MLEISTSGLMSEDGKRSGLFRAQPPRPSSTLLIGVRRSALRSSEINDRFCSRGGCFDIQTCWTRRRWDGVRLGPKFVSDTFRLDGELRPPSHFIPGLMQVPMMGAAQRHRELIADLEAEASWLREAQVMGVRRLAAANHAGLRGDKLAVTFVAAPPCFGRHGIRFKLKR